MRDPQICLFLPLLARPHRHAPILQTKPVDTSTLSAHESELAPRAANGGEGLESLHDLSAKAEVRYSMGHVDLTNNEIGIGAAIINTSKDPIPGRLILRLLAFSSSNGLIEVENADNSFIAS